MAFIACIEKRLGEGEAGAGEAGAGEAVVAAAGVVEAAGAATADGTAIAPEAEAAVPAAAAYPPGPRLVPASVEEDNALDLGSAVMPVLIKRYAGYAAAALVGLVIGILLGRRGRD